MKVLLKFTIVCAWLLFLAALWQMRQAPATSVAGRALPASGWLSISRKMTEKETVAQPLTDAPSTAWPNPDLQITIPKTDL